VVGQVAIAIRHEVNNALAAIIAEGQLLEEDGRSLIRGQTVAREHHCHGRRVNASMEKLATVSHAPVTDYTPGEDDRPQEALAVL